MSKNPWFMDRIHISLNKAVFIMRILLVALLVLEENKNAFDFLAFKNNFYFFIVFSIVWYGVTHYYGYNIAFMWCY